MASDRIAKQVESLLEAARAAGEAGDAEQSRALATAILALDPGHAEAQALLDGAARRLQMTLMFCDLVESTALTQVLDPEDLTDVLRAYRSACAGVVERYGGFIEDRQGDGLLVRFGYPSVHEDDARRGVLSGLEIAEAVDCACARTASSCTCGSPSTPASSCSTAATSSARRRTKPRACSRSRTRTWC